MLKSIRSGHKGANMAYQMGPLNYQKSTDDLPTDLQAGTRMQFTDTGERFIFDGEGWIEDLAYQITIN